MTVSSRNLLSSQIKTADEIWLLIHDTDIPADRWLGNHFHRYRKKFGSRDRRFIAEVIYSLFRNLTFFQTWSENLKKECDSLLLVLLAASCENLIEQKDFDLGLRDLGIHTDSERLYKNLQDHILPGGLAFKSMEEKLACQYSYPLWFLRRWSSQWGLEKTERLLSSFQTRPPLVIRSNPLKISRKKLTERLQKKGLRAQPTNVSAFAIALEQRIPIFETDEFKQGLFEIQDEGSQLVCEKTLPKPGEVIWDVCAGGGGKSLALAALMNNQGRIIATDIRHHKLDELKKRARRAGVYNIFPADLTRMQETAAIRKGLDKILIDAPCSGTGTLRRNPDAKWKYTEGCFADYQKDQIKIIESVLPYLSEKTLLFYVTCSLEREENQGTIQAILAAHLDLELAKLPSLEDGVMTLWPDVHGTDGFFMAAIRKRK